MNFPEYKVLDQQQTTDVHSIRFEIKLSPELDFFDGHFDQMAILPAVAQLYMVKKLADQYLDVVGSFTGLRQLKFKAPIVPNPVTEILIEHKIEAHQLVFQFEHSGQLKSKGVFQFETKPTPQS